jgi:hypothetical protein
MIIDEFRAIWQRSRQDRRNRDLGTFYDRALARLGPIVAAEALRRLLLAMAHGPLPRSLIAMPRQSWIR